MRTTSIKGALLAGLAAIPCLSPGVAMAQDSEPQAAAPPADSSTTDGEIIVTARKTRERLIDVPISITALDSGDLAKSGVDGSRALTQLVPGLNFATQGAFVEPTIRGVGTSLAGTGSDANVAVYIDGVYQSNQAANSFEFGDVDRIEVLKGPQGTLFGRNATGGAITITTRKPSYDPTFDLNATYGNYNHVKLSGYGSVGLTKWAAISVAALYEKEGAYVTNAFTGHKIDDNRDFAVRSKLLIEPSSNFTVTLQGHYSNQNDPTIYANRPIDRNNVYLRTMGGFTISDDLRVINADTNPSDRVKKSGGSMTASLSAASGTFTSITAYEHVLGRLTTDTDVTPLPISSLYQRMTSDTYTQEVNYASNFTGPLNFVAGFYYYNDDAGKFSTSRKGPSGVLVSATAAYTLDIKAEALAGYAEFTYKLSDKLRVIGGLRYSTERRTALANYLTTAALIPGPAVVDTSKRWNAWTPRASVVFAIDGETNIYATYSRGFKSGVFNQSDLSQHEPVDPEFIDAYEIGLHHFGPHFSINSSAFLYNYTDIQVSTLTNFGGVSKSELQNAANARIYGGDLDISWTISPAWSLKGGLAYTHARYTSFPDALLTSPIAGGGNTQTPEDASGNHMIRTPEFQANATLSLHQPLFGGFFEASVTPSYNDGFYWDPGERLRQDPYFLLNARVGWTTEDGKTRVSVWGENLTDETYSIYAATSTTGNTSSYMRPRSYGITIGQSF